MDSQSVAFSPDFLINRFEFLESIDSKLKYPFEGFACISFLTMWFRLCPYFVLSTLKAIQESAVCNNCH